MQKYQPEYTQKILRKICVNLEPDIFMFLYKTKYMHKQISNTLSVGYFPFCVCKLNIGSLL